MTKKFYITTAIAYVNGPPHMGHALEVIEADAYSRFNKSLDRDVFLQTGTDENGLKNWQTAQKEDIDIKDFLNRNTSLFKKLYAELDVEYDNFVVTSSANHHLGVKKIWNKLVESGDIYKKQYKGLYCVGCESYKTEKELVDGKCPDHPTKDIEIFEEENYFFKLSKYKDEIFKLISNNTYEIVPESRKNEILEFLKNANDISFSRPITKLPHGVVVPNDPEHIIYVWCDALSNYLTGIGYGQDSKDYKELWPADAHIVGKDILRFHAAYWPAILLSAGIELPKKLFVHGWLLTNGQKMSKSTGNAIDPFEEIKAFGKDIFRFYLLGCMSLGRDGDYTRDLLKDKINSELVSNFSNFCYRTLSFIEKKYSSNVTTLHNDVDLIKKIKDKEEIIKELYNNFKFKKVLEEILNISQLGNQYFQSNEPWKENPKSIMVLTTCVNIIKDLCILLKPIIPSACDKLEKQLNLKNLKWKDLGFNLENHKLNKSEILFKKI